MKTLDELNGYDKAAIIFDILGDSLSINMFKDIPEAEFYKLRDHAKSLKNTVSTSVKKEVLEDYYFKMLSNEKYKDQPSSENMFEFLVKLDDEQLFALLSPEQPRVIALALEQVDNEKRMTFLSKVDPEKQNKIVLSGHLNNHASIYYDYDSDTTVDGTINEIDYKSQQSQNRFTIKYIRSIKEHIGVGIKIKYYSK